MLLENKKILIMGIRNKWSIAYGIAKSAYENGAKLIFTYMGEENKDKMHEYYLKNKEGFLKEILTTTLSIRGNLTEKESGALIKIVSNIVDKTMVHEKAKVMDIKTLLAGSFSSVIRVGDTIIKVGTPRKTLITDEVEEIKIDTTSMIPREDVVVVVTNDGYIKRVSQRSYATNTEETYLKDGDYIIGLYNINTTQTVLVFTDMGNYLFLPVHEIPEVKWKDIGKHVSNIVSMSSDEKIIGSMPVYNFDDDRYITIFTKNGMVKRTKLEEFVVQRYSKAVNMMKLKDKDEVISDYFKNYEGKQIMLPSRCLPSKEFLEYHNNYVFEKIL